MARVGVAILGSTGSVGEATLDVIARHPDRFRVVALGAHRNAARLAEQALRFSAPYVALADARGAAKLEQELRARGASTRVLAGPGALEAIATLPEVDSVMAAIVGAAGLRSTLAAARAGKRLLLANKESLVMAGPLLMRTVRESGATLLPIDSEHNAVFQCLPRDTIPGVAPPGVKRILLTASGGPFLDADARRLEQVTPDQACAHPNWVMGRKISVDSATLMNKGLEFIEACLLFGVIPRTRRSADSSRKHRALAGRIRRRLGAGAVRRAGHAHAHRPCAGVAGARQLGCTIPRPREGRKPAIRGT